MHMHALTQVHRPKRSHNCQTLTMDKFLIPSIAPPLPVSQHCTHFAPPLPDSEWKLWYTCGIGEPLLIDPTAVCPGGRVKYINLMISHHTTHRSAQTQKACNVKIAHPHAHNHTSTPTLPHTLIHSLPRLIHSPST